MTHPRGHLVADGKVIVAMRHQAKAFGGIDEHDVVGNLRAGFGCRGAAHQRGGVDCARAAGALLHRILRAAGDAEAAVEILQERRRRGSLHRRSLPRPWSSPPVFRSSHLLQEHADMRGQHAAVAVQQRDRGIAAPAGGRRRRLICKWVSRRDGAMAPPTSQLPGARRSPTGRSPSPRCCQNALIAPLLPPRRARRARDLPAASPA